MTAMDRRFFVILIRFLALVLVVGAVPMLVCAETSSLAQVEERVIKSFPSVPRMEVAQLLKARTAKNLPPIIFDVRFQDQYEVSHIQGAIHLNPATKIEKFAELYGDLIRLNPQRKILFYCYVGYNSFAIAEKIRVAFPEWAGRVYALNGGVFAWYNQKNLLIDSAGPTPLIYPHDFMWRGFLINPENISYEPRQNAGH